MRRIATTRVNRIELARVRHREQELARALVRALDDHDLELLITAARVYAGVLDNQQGDPDDSRNLKDTAEFLREALHARPLIEMNEGH